HADILARTGTATFEIAADRDAVAAAVDQLALQLLLFRPAKILQAAVQRLLVIAGVGLRALIERLYVRERPRHLMLGDQIAAAELDAVDAEIVCRHVETPLAEEIGLEAPRPAISARRRLVGEQQRHLEIEVRHPIGP